MTIAIVVDVLGWIGAVLLLYAYARVSAGSWNGQARWFQICNVAGSILFIINSGYHGAYPSVFVNIVWGAIALRVVARGTQPAVPRDAS